ncbi:MAG TPA: TadE family protein [Anaerolineales bacterium]|nr:TadE family protein [Anaerolineales bacterium]
MFIKKFLKQNQLSGYRAQAIVEFAIVLPILMALLVGILEVGRMVFIYAAVTNASREASRYGSAVGKEDVYGYEKYRYCEGIQNAAERSAFLISLSRIDIKYDTGSAVLICDAATGEDADISVDSGDRVIVTVEADYEPMVTLLPFPSRKFTSTSARTILGFFELGSDPLAGGGGGGGSSGTLTAISNTQTAIAGTPSSTPMPTSTIPSDTPTPTATVSGGDLITFTPLPSTTPTDTPTITPTFTPSNTPTITFTPTMTATPTMTLTPTSTSTPVPGCNNIWADSIYIPGGNPTMSLTIINPHDAITVLDVRVRWNAASGAPGSRPLILQTASLAGTFWTGSNNSGDLTITPASTVTIPGNNQTSVLVFTFDKNYQNKNNLELITIRLSTPGCEGIQIQRP